MLVNINLIQIFFSTTGQNLRHFESRLKKSSTESELFIKLMLISAFVLIGSYQLLKLSVWQRRGYGAGCLAWRTVFKLGDKVIVDEFGKSRC